MKKFKVVFFFFLFARLAYGQQWGDVGGGADNAVRCFYEDTISNLLYTGGSFEYLGASSIHQIGVWDGNVWSAVGANSQFTNLSFSGSIASITLFNGDIIVGGLFDSVAGLPLKNIARWNGSQWSAMGEGFDDQVMTLQVYNGELYAGGEFHHSGNDTVYNIAKWNGINWVGLEFGLDNIVSSMTVFNNQLIVGGLFNGPYSSSVIGKIVAWDGNAWLSMNAAFNNSVIVVKAINDTLYAGGQFTSFSFNHSYYISRWNGNTWQTMPYPNGGSQPCVTDIVSYSDNLYVCGYFTTPPDIAKFNGSGYDSIGNALGYIKNMTVFNGELYVAGGFSSINGISLSNIARYRITDQIKEEATLINPLLVFPNPISKNEKLNFKFYDKASKHCVNLFDSKGICIDVFFLNNSESSIDLPKKLQPGNYIISVKDAKSKKQSIKLILN